jgi:hypothetical protein
MVSKLGSFWHKLFAFNYTLSKLGFFWHKLFAFNYTLSGDRLVETPLLMQNLSQALSLLQQELLHGH